MIQETSLEAYKVLEPELGDRQRTIYNMLKTHPNISNLDISRIMSIPINSVTPRVKELRDKGLVVFSNYKTDRITNRRVMCWKIVC